MNNRDTNQYGKGAALLSVGIGLTGLVTYGYFSLANHALTDEQYGNISLLWAAVFMTVSILYRPVEQLLSRTIAERQALGRSGFKPLRVAATIQLALGVVFVVAALAFAGKITDGLFGGNTVLFWIMVSAVLAYAVSYFARGFLAGNRLFGLYSALVFMEATSRILFAVAAVVGLAHGMTVVALGIVAGPVVSLFVVPAALTRKARQTLAPKQAEPDDGEEFTLAHGSGFAAAVLVIMVCEQAFLNAGPLIVKATADSNGTVLAGFVFSLLLVFRAPVQLFQAIGTSLLPHLTNMKATDSDQSFKKSVSATVKAVVAFSLAVAVGLFVIGPTVMHAFFPKYRFDRVGLALIAVGMGFYLAAATLNQAALAQGQVRRAALRWCAAAAFFVIWLVVSGIEDAGRNVEFGFLAASFILCALLYGIYRRPNGHRGDVPTPGSPEELELELAAADEAT